MNIEKIIESLREKDSIKAGKIQVKMIDVLERLKGYEVEKPLEKELRTYSIFESDEKSFLTMPYIQAEYIDINDEAYVEFEINVSEIPDLQNTTFWLHFINTDEAFMELKDAMSAEFDLEVDEEIFTLEISEYKPFIDVYTVGGWNFVTTIEACNNCDLVFKKLQKFVK